MANQCNRGLVLLLPEGYSEVSHPQPRRMHGYQFICSMIVRQRRSTRHTLPDPIGGSPHSAQRTGRQEIELYFSGRFAKLKTLRQCGLAATSPSAGSHSVVQAVAFHRNVVIDGHAGPVVGTRWATATDRSESWVSLVVVLLRVGCWSQVDRSEPDQCKTHDRCLPWSSSGLPAPMVEEFVHSQHQRSPEPSITIRSLHRQLHQLGTGRSSMPILSW